ncbi:MAG: 6-bladed beta-propeller [Balneolaceae bacterium]|nr:MAG: 6-bladed beta-propeller [Balneolaceae bacterium]
MINYFNFIPAGLLLWIMTTGCTSNDVMPEVPEHIHEMENVTIYSSGDISSVNTLKLNYEQTFGSSDHVVLGNLGSIEVDRDGKLFVTDMDQKTIHVFLPDGSYLTNIGREGSGPGEFYYINSLKVISDGLYVLDSARQMESVFSTTTFDLLSTMNLRPVNLNQIEEIQGANPSRYEIRSDGMYLVGFLPRRRMESIEGERTVPYYLMERDRTINTEKIIRVNDLQFLTTTMNGEPWAATFPFTPMAIISISINDEIYVSGAEDFLIKIYNPSGDYIRAFYHSSYTGVSLERSALLRDYPNEMHQKMIREANLPETWPALDAMLFDDESRIWVSTIVEDFEIYEWWVLDDETGELITRFEWPRSKPLKVVRNGHVYTRETDEETGLQAVVRYRVELK